MGSGGGERLLRAGVERLRDTGYRAATAWVLEPKQRARHFYERAGWRLDGAHKDTERTGVALDEVRYRIEISPNSPSPDSPIMRAATAKLSLAVSPMRSDHAVCGFARVEHPQRQVSARRGGARATARSGRPSPRCWAAWLPCRCLCQKLRPARLLAYF